MDVCAMSGKRPASFSNRPDWLRGGYEYSRLSIFTCDEEGSSGYSDLRSEIDATIQSTFMRVDVGGSAGRDAHGDSERAGTGNGGGLSAGDGGNGGEHFSG